ncbi:hypothetical protein ES288_A11G334500v1, partial [Gossypium darwinii]
FRGKDTRDGFVSHLYKDLCRKNIQTFIDDEELRKGDEISGALLTAIQGSRVSVIVFSKDYASSKWCLAELVKIMDCNKWIVPVFYGVDPRDVRNQRGSFADAFAKHEENFKHELEKVKTWRSALTAAGKLSGWDSQVTRPDSTLIDKIVEDIVKKLNCGTSSANLKGLVGNERRMQEVLSLFQDGFPDFRMLGFWGMGGIGKTTLADAIYHHVSNGFQSCCFLANVREHDERRKLLKLRQKLLSNTLGDKNLDISTLTIGLGILKDRLSRMKVLIVCDDVSTLSQLEFLIGGTDWFGPGSRVIVTTRDKQVLIHFDIYPVRIYEVEELDGDESVQLFCQRAFKSSHPIEYQLQLSKMVLSVANGNPLAIKLIGSSLRGKTQSYQESEVKKLKQFPKQDIQNVLKWSFDALDFEERNDRDHVTWIMDACYVSAYSGIENLIDKSLISVSKNQIAMHDLLQQMGWNIVRNESPFKPEKCRRLWIPEDSYNVLSEKNGTETLTGIVLDMSKLPKLELDPTALMKMRKLRFLKLYNSCGRILLFKGLLSFPEELRYLYWEGYPLRSLPTKFDLRYLVELDMRESHLEQLWEGKQNLVRIPDLSSATNLEEVNLSRCFNLRELPSSLQRLEKLTYLNFYDCKNLCSFPEILETMEIFEGITIDNLIGLKVLRLNNCKNLVYLPDSLYKLKSLKRFYLEGCSRLEIFPEILETMEMLRELDLSGTALKELPSSIDNLIGLEVLRLNNCKNLVYLPNNLYKLKSLKRFDLNDHGYVEELDLSGTALKELPSPIDNLIGLKVLRLNNCKNLVCLPDNLYKLKSLKRFDLEGCSRLEIFPEILETMERLSFLDLSGTALKELPSSIDNLISLDDLRLKNCENLVCLPDSLYNLKSLERFYLEGCSRLEIFPEILETMEMLRELDLSGTALKELPSSIDNLIGLRSLTLNNFEKLFTAIGGRPVKQKHLHGLSSLKKLDLTESNLEDLPTTIKQFPLLEELILRKCKRLKSLPELPPSLEYLDAHDCISLEDVSSIKKLFEQALFCDSTSVEEVSSIEKVLKQAVFCRSLGWLFTNCFQLDQKAASGPETPKLEMPFEHMVTVLKDYHQASNKRMYNGAWFKFYPLVFNGDWSQSVCCEVKHYGVHISFAEEEAEVQPYKRFKYQS